MSMAALELFMRDIMEWKFALFAVPTLIIAWLSCKFLFLDAFMSPLRNLPGPATSMFLGNMLELKMKDSLGATSEWSKKYGGIFVMWLRPGMYVIFENRSVTLSIAFTQPGVNNGQLLSREIELMNFWIMCYY